MKTRKLTRPGGAGGRARGRRRDGAGGVRQPEQRERGLRRRGERFAGSAATSDGDAISIQDFSFTPSTTTVAAGTTVTWTNNDAMVHDVHVHGRA